MKRSKFEKLVCETGDLPTLPTVAQNVLAIINNEGANANALAEIIEFDPVITSRVVRLANSAYYRMPGTEEVADVHRAVVVLGFLNIRNIVVSTCLKSIYTPEFKANHFSATDLWEHSVMVAVISRLLAAEVAPEIADEAFMAGIVHDVGMIVEWNLLPRQFPQVLNRFQGTGIEFCTCERETLGFDHCEAGATVLRNWKIPKAIRDAVARHHSLRKRKRSGDPLAEIVNLAERVCCQRGNGFFDHIRDDRDIQDVLGEFYLSGIDFDAILSKVDEEMAKAKEMLAF